jgi:DNA repair exonuclease SbcCD ATPase subunit
MTLQELRYKLEQKKGERSQIERTITSLQEQISEGKKSLRAHEKARTVLQEVGLKTQQQLSYNVSAIASLALETVFDTPYKLELEFVERRNKTECDIYFVRDDVKLDPFSGGGGVIDVAAFALRVALWTMQQPKTRPTMILDEPFKHLKGEVANRKMLEMVSKISKKLGIQIIMVSDERVNRETTVEFANKLFETSIIKGKTKIQEI